MASNAREPDACRRARCWLSNLSKTSKAVVVAVRPCQITKWLWKDGSLPEGQRLALLDHQFTAAGNRQIQQLISGLPIETLGPFGRSLDLHKLPRRRIRHVHVHVRAAIVGVIQVQP